MPWVLYKATQANVHLLVMYLFKLHLLRRVHSTEQESTRADEIVPST
ncbi:hypothetical protein OVA29_09545 [Exiguobacterium sp. SL14]|nr:hypothetical protein [Exiguobacterium sp. SL14]MCY1690878.1 hypothetical protein [Exiguobacterium sp. SL14]